METINKKYILLEKIGSGSFGSIYKGQNIRTKEFVAIKMEPIEYSLKLLKNESKIYQYLNGVNGIPNVKWYGKDTTNYYMVINLLGESLQNIMDKRGNFPLSLVLKLGIQIINILKDLHNKGLVHRDIKPDNFLFDLNENKIKKLYLIDFGFCKTYLDENSCHNKIKKLSSMIGSKNYASIMSHNYYELSRRDDLESLGYMLIYFYYGFLPWNSLTDNNEILNSKIQITNDTRIPYIIADFLKYIKNLEYEETPNYYLLIQNFTKEIELLSKIS